MYKEFLSSSGVSTDTRSLKGNELFFALKGENFNGNVFVLEALEKGSRLVVADDPDLAPSSRIWIVEDSLKMLQDLAHYHRNQWGGKVLAITGSNGKTTTKELVAAVLAQKYKVLSTSGNLNNHIGVPLTLLRLKDEEIAVVEMGANHHGEIARLSQIAAPDLGIITNIGKAHLEGFGSLRGVREAKGELYDYLAVNHKSALANLSSDVLKEMIQERKLEVFSYGLEETFIVSGNPGESSGSINGKICISGKEYPVNSSLFGEYNFLNMLAAAAAGEVFGVDHHDIISSLESYKSENNRSQRIEGKTNKIILDAYNANPTSMGVAISEFSRMKDARKMVILGDMYELGEDSAREHQHLLKLLNELSFDEVLLVGSMFAEFSQNPEYPFHFFMTIEECIGFLEQIRPSGYTILLKGSRKNTLEKATNILLDC